MKSLIKLTLCFVLLTSCGGSKDSPKETPKDEELGAFNLVFPDNNLICTEGEDINNNEVSISFIWSASKNATSYEFTLTNLDNNEVINETVSSTSLDLTLPKGSQFTWSVSAVLNNSKKESTSWNFYSEGVTVENYAPFPASITVEDNNNGTVNINWTGSDLDNDIAHYTLMVDDVVLLDNTTNVSYSAHQITYGTTFKITIITEDTIGHTSTVKKDFIFNN